MDLNNFLFSSYFFLMVYFMVSLRELALMKFSLRILYLWACSICRYNFVMVYGSAIISSSI